MNRFLLVSILLTLLTVSYSATIAKPTDRWINYDLCYMQEGQMVVLNSSLNMTLFSFDCTNPEELAGNYDFDNGGSYGPRFFRVAVGAGESASPTFLNNPDIVVERILNCALTPDPSTNLCGPITILYRVTHNTSDATATFDFDPGITDISILPDIDITENSGSGIDDGFLCVGDDLTLEALFNTTPTGGTIDWTGPGGFTASGNPIDILDVQTTNTGTYTVTYTDPNGCTSTENVLITVDPLPEFTINVAETSGTTDNDGILCVNDDMTLTATFTVGSGSTYEWDFPGGTSTDYPLDITGVTVGDHNGIFNLTVTDANGCTNTAQIDITIEDLPQVFTTTLRACETVKGGGTADFTLTDAEEAAGWPTGNQNTGTEVDGGAGLDVTYHGSQSDANNGTSALTSPYTSGTATIWARVEDSSTGCFDVIEVELEVDEKPDTGDTELRACAIMGNPTQAEFELQDAELAPDYPNNQNFGPNDVQLGGGGVTVTYHATLNDAENNNTSTIASPYVSGNTTIFARIEDDVTGCFHTAEITLTVVDLPDFDIEPSETSALVDDDGILCEDDELTLTVVFNSGSGDTYEWEYPGGTSSDHPLVISNVTVAEHNGTFTVTVTDANGCSNTAEIDITVEFLPDVFTTTLRECETVKGGGDAEFNLPDAEEPAGWPGTNQNTGTEVDGGAGLDVSYHSSENDARDDVGALSSPYVSGTATIWARVEDPSTGCYDVIEVELEVDEKPDTEDTELSACALLSDPSMAEFELEDAELAPDYPNNQNSGSGQVSAGAGGVTVTYHPSLGDAENNTGQLSSPYMSGSTTIYARVEDDVTGCFHTAEITLVVVALPSVSDTELKACEDPAGSMSAEFTLTDAELAPDFPNGNSNDGSDITNGDGTLIVTYHDSQQDAEDGVGDIGTTVVRADGTTVYARLEDPATGCFNVAEVLLTALESPDPEIQFMGDPADFEICEDEDITLDVVVTTGTAPYEYEWTLPDNSTATGNPYSFTADPDVHDGTWTVTVTDANGCTGTDDINITVNPAPENNDCSSAEDVGTGYDPISFSGNNICASSGGPCSGTDNESAVYFIYTVPDDGLTRLVVDVPGFQVSIGPGCGSGNCETNRAILECPDPGAQIYITVSSSEANEGSFSGNITPVVEVPDITGVVFVDLDANGTFGGNDIPLGDVEIQLFPDCDRGATPLTFTTGDDGVYTFTNLPFPPRQWFVTVSEDSEVQCDGAEGECIVLDLCSGEDQEFDFPCTPPDCLSNPYSIDNICQTAYDNPLCDLRVIEEWPCGQNPSELGPWANQAHCAGVFHNTSFYGFVAGSGDYEINFTIFNCAGTGVQYGVYDACEPNGGPICNGNANTGTVTIPSDQLTPCRTYVFWIDGFSASVCSYYAFVTGDWNNCSVPPVVDIILDPGCDKPEPYCPSFDLRTLTLIPDDAEIIIPLEDINDARYIWSITSPRGVLTTLPEVVGPDGITLDWVFAEEGTYEVCVQVGHPCDGLRDPFCKEFTFESIVDVDTTFVVCTGDFPWSGAYDEDGNEILDQYGNHWYWIGGEVTLGMVRQRPIPLFGTEQVDECGCPYTQTFRFVEATTSTGTDSIALCPSEIPFAYNGISVEQNMTDSLIRLDGVESVNGCDSLVSLTARILTMGGRITDECVDNNNSVPPTFRLTFTMGAQFINVDRDSVKYVWKDNMGNVLSGTDSTMTSIVVGSIGTYTLEIFSYKFGKQCLFTLNHTFNVTNRLPGAVQADNWPQKICDTDNIATYSVVAADPTLTYIWTVPSTATKIQDDSTGVITVRWDGPTGGDICVFARNNCGDGPPTCLPVEYIAPTTPDFDMALEVCKDGRTPITATSTHLNPPVLFFWDFDGGSPETPAGNDPGPHNVAWNDSGDKVVSLYVTENGCPSDTISKTISVIDPSPPPVLSCFESTVDGVVFEWTEIQGATDYNVQIITAGVTGVREGTNRFRVTGLTVGQCVEIQVEAVIPDACGNVTSAILECCASNCVLPTITIAPFAEICLTSTSPVVTLDESLVTTAPATTGTSTWAVRAEGTPNFVDVTEFDPNVWGIGTHTIRYTLVWDGGQCRQTAQTTIRVKETPLSTFTIGTPGCVLNPVTIQYTGGGSTGTFTWNFGPNVIGNYAGPGPHNVRWSTVGPHTITLQVSRDGCVSTVTTQSVTLNPTLAVPVVTCTEQRRDGVTFGWDAVANASGYNVTVTNLTTGAVIFTGFVTNLTQDVPGLNQGDNVRILVEAVSSNGCPNTQSTANCVASACPQARITFPVNPITVCNGDDILPLTYNITNTLPGVVPVVTWTSTSAGVDSDNATFNVRAAGPGTHIITLTYTQDDCEWSEDLVITVRPVPVASFNGPAVICIDDAWFVNYTGTMSGGRVLNWDNGGGNRTELGPNDFSFRFPAPGTYTVGLTVTLNGCESDLFTRQVVVEAVPASPVVRCESTDFDRVTFAWDPIPCATEYDIRINGVPRPRQTTTTFTETGLMEDESVEIEVSAISTCACDIPAVTHTCVAKACPTRMVEIPQDRLTFCLQDTVIRLVSSITPAPSNPDPVVTWTTTSNGLNATANTFDIQAAGVGTHTLTVTYRHDGCQWSRNLTVVVNPVPVSAFTAPAVICIEDSWDVIYTGSLEAGRTYIWNEDGAVRTSTSLINHSFRWSQPGTYTVSLQVELNGCLSNVFSQSVVVEAVPAPVEIRCADTSFDRVSFAWDPIPCATEYDIRINGQARPRQTATTFTLTNLNEGDQITIEVIPVSTCACPIASSSRTCIARACPPVVINLVPSQSAICLTNDVANVVIRANVTGNTPDGRGTWSGPGIDQNGNFNPRTAGIGVHQIVYDYQDSDCSYQATTQVEVNEVPRIVWEVVNPQCFNDLTGTFLFTIEGGTPPYTLTVDGRNVSAGQASGLSIGAHTFIVSDAKGCSATQTFNITPAPQPSFTISGPAILDISEDGTHRLNLNGMAGVNIDSIVWLLNDVRVCGGVPPACTEITSRYPKGPQRYNVTIYYNNGCQVSATSSFLVTQTYVITFPSVIYPNSNAGNREFRIFTDDPTLFVRKMRIYDRWGNLVFIAENFSAQDPAVWNGRFNGQDVVQGVYVFVFEMENENEEDIIESGDVTVMW